MMARGDSYAFKNMLQNVQKIDMININIQLLYNFQTNYYMNILARCSLMWPNNWENVSNICKLLSTPVWPLPFNPIGITGNGRIILTKIPFATTYACFVVSDSDFNQTLKSWECFITNYHFDLTNIVDSSQITQASCTNDMMKNQPENPLLSFAVAKIEKPGS